MIVHGTNNGLSLAQGCKKRMCQKIIWQRFQGGDREHSTADSTVPAGVEEADEGRSDVVGDAADPDDDSAGLAALLHPLQAALQDALQHRRRRRLVDAKQTKQNKIPLQKLLELEREQGESI
jgi:hypothetical protein